MIKKNYSGESSPYWEWMNKHTRSYDDGDISEFPEANPDVLAEKENNVDTSRHKLIDKFVRLLVNNLSDKERLVTLLLQKEMTEREIAIQLRVSNSTVQEYKTRIRNKAKKLVMQNPKYGDIVSHIVFS